MTDVKTNRPLWQDVNNKLVAKCISELQYEECFEPKKMASGYMLTLQSGVVYYFSAWQTIWGQLRVDADSLLRNQQPVVDAGRFFIDAQSELALNDIILANLLEECMQTLTGDVQSWQVREGVSAEDISSMDVDTQQVYLDGHPKAVLNKGRMGWGIDELLAFTPESNQTVQMHWVAIQKEMCTIGMQKVGLDHELIQRSMSDADWNCFSVESEPFLDKALWVIVPVHPWQWQKKIQIHFRFWIEEGVLCDLGQYGHRFLPLQSIRTLANIDDPTAPNIKLPITILNTSCYRGIPGKYIEIGAALSDWLNQLCESDDLLKNAGTIVLQEPIGVHCAHPLYRDISEPPYRYNEMLGVIWRDSIQSKLQQGERAMLVSALLQQSNDGTAIVRCLINQSGMTAANWLSAYFKAVVIPLYHLMCQYGIGLVAHGQNLTLIVKNGVPVRLAIKDLQGDLRLVNQEFEELASLPEHIKSVLTRLPAEYLIHDLQTGHFVTVLRYFSALLQEQGITDEVQFYQVLADELTEYKSRYSQLQKRFELFDLFLPWIKRVCINKVRFKEGYGDNFERPLPALGSDLENPLVKAIRIKSQEFSNE